MLLLGMLGNPQQESPKNLASIVEDPLSILEWLPFPSFYVRGTNFMDKMVERWHQWSVVSFSIDSRENFYYTTNLT